MKKILLITTFLMSCISIANAEDAFKVAVVDVDKIIFESKVGKDLSKKLQDTVNHYQNKFSGIEKDLGKERDNLQKKQAVLSADAFEKNRKEFETKAFDFQKQVQNERGKIDKARLASLEKIDQVAKSITKEIASQEHYSLVVPSSLVLYYVNSIDITEKILEGLNKKMTSVDFKVE